MCLAVPSKVVSIDEARMALVDIMGVQRRCSLMLTPDAQVGDYVLVHAGYAIQRIEEQDAHETLRLLTEIPDLLGDELGDAGQKADVRPTSAGSASDEQAVDAAGQRPAAVAQA